MRQNSKLLSPLMKMRRGRHGQGYVQLTSRCSISGDDDRGVLGKAKKGFVPIYVGEERKRYLIAVKSLSSPFMQALFLQHDSDHDHEELYGCNADGPVALPFISTDQFEMALKQLKLP
ncbi:hypothetical protein Sjap_017741 [Stephania japonica]|uniref:Uncharacterized protein n=1 Tax=Stephania japonica TaxID=461633 RepID=A0AAP0I6Z3_9MAGN